MQPVSSRVWRGRPPVGWIVLLVLTIVTAAQAQTFKSQLLNGGDLRAQAPLTHDYDADGDLDIVIVKRAIGFQVPPGLGLLVNEGNGQFSHRDILSDPTLVAPEEVHSCDCDNDGRTDYIVVDRGFTEPGQLVWYQRQADESFIKWTIASGVSYWQIAVADFNNDGNADVVAVGSDPPAIDVYVNDGLLNFTKTPLPVTDVGLFLVDAGDMNGDGQPDIVAGSSRDSRLFLNTGTGRFDTGRPIGTGFGGNTLLGGVEIADVNLDGVPDLLSFGLFSALHILDGARNFASTPIEPGENNSGGYIRVADIDANGLPDIIRQRIDTSDEINTLAIIYQDMPNVFRPVTLDQSPGSGHDTPIAVGDLDGDLDPDVVYIDNGGDSDISWYENIAGQLHRHTLFGEIRGAQQPKFVDLDADGDLDVVLVAGLVDALDNTSENEVLWYENRGEFGFVEWRIDDNLPAPADVEVADLNGDGINDVVATARGSGDLVWYKRNGAIWERFLIEDNANEPLGCTVADLDADGDNDLALTSSADNKVYWYLNNGLGTFARRVVDPNLVNPREVEAADLNADGHVDLVVVATGTTNSVATYLNNGMQQFTRQVVHSGQAASDIAIADWDRNNTLDLMVSFNDECSSGNLPNLMLFTNNGQANFTRRPLLPNCVATTSIELDDMNGDTNPDAVFGALAVALLPQVGIAFQQNGNLSPPSEVDVVDGFDVTGLDVGDVNGDGILDLIVTAPVVSTAGDVVLLTGE